MLDRSTPQYWFGRFALGLLVLVAAGLGLPQRLGLRDPIGLVTLALGGFGFWLSLTSVGPMARVGRFYSNTRREWGKRARIAFERASLPRRIFYLLVAVAECDGPIKPHEREVVRRFLLERFLDPIQAGEIHSWEAQPLPIEDLVGLAARIAIGLDEAELDTLFSWCCLVAFADGRFHANEHNALHEVARGLDLPGPRARMLFHLARAQFLSGGRGPRQDAGTHRATARSPRVDALAVLGLPADATEEQVRRRHRELVRKFHPDAQPHLGPVALREATERFQAIQRAYETLRATA